MRTLLIDDHALFSEGLEMLLEKLDPEIECDSARSISAALNCEGPFDLILLDYGLPDSTGVLGLRQILDRFEGTPVVMLSGEEGSAIVHDVIDSGATGFIPKSYGGKEMLGALDVIMRGGVFLPTYAIEGDRPQKRATAAEVGLTERQADCLMHLVLGKPNKVIAREMGLSDNTVKAHLSGAFKILGVTNRVEAVFKVAALGLFHSLTPDSLQTAIQA